MWLWIVLAALAAACVHYLERRRFPLTGGKSLVRIRTADGARLALYRRAPDPSADRRREPLLLLSGFGLNHWVFDYADDTSWARQFAACGFDTWLLDLRRSGLSRGARRRDGSFDDYLRDVEAAIEHILRTTGSAKLHGVGYSIGGLLLYAALRGHLAHCLRSVVALEAPVTLEGYPLGARGRAALAALRTLGVCEVPYRWLTRAAIPFLRWLHASPAFTHWTNPRNMDLSRIPTILYRAFDNVPVPLATQFLRWTERAGVRSWDGSVDYLDGLHRTQVPILVLVGHNHFSARATPVTARIGGPCRVIECSAKHGFSEDYGHADLILGRHALSEVFPLALYFIAEFDGAPEQSAALSTPEFGRSGNRIPVRA